MTISIETRKEETDTGFPVKFYYDINKW